MGIGKSCENVDKEKLIIKFGEFISGEDGKISNTFASITKPYSKKFIKSIEENIKN